jgi:hypothetical protein
MLIAKSSHKLPYLATVSPINGQGSYADQALAQHNNQSDYNSAQNNLGVNNVAELGHQLTYAGTHEANQNTAQANQNTQWNNVATQQETRYRDYNTAKHDDYDNKTKYLGLQQTGRANELTAQHNNTEEGFQRQQAVAASNAADRLAEYRTAQLDNAQKNFGLTRQDNFNKLKAETVQPQKGDYSHDGAPIYKYDAAKLGLAPATNPAAKPKPSREQVKAYFAQQGGQ